MKSSIFSFVALLVALLLAPIGARAQWVNMHGQNVRNSSGGLLTSGQFCIQPVDGNNHPIIASISAFQTTGTWTSGATTLLAPGAFGNVRVGEPVQGVGIPVGAYVTGSTSPNVTISTGTTSAAASATTLIFGGGSVLTGPSCTPITNGVFGTPWLQQLNGFDAPDTSISNPQNLCLRVTITDSSQNGKTVYTASCAQPSSGSGSSSWCTLSAILGQITDCNYDLFSPALPLQALQQTGPTGPAGPPGTGFGGATGMGTGVQAVSSLLTTTGVTVTQIAFPSNTSVLVSGFTFMGPISASFAFTVPTNGATGSSSLLTCSSKLALGTLPTSTWVATVYKYPAATAGCASSSPTSIGTVSLSTSGVQTWSVTQTSFAAGDCLALAAPATQDLTAANPYGSMCVVK